MTEEQIQAMKDEINDYVFDHWEELGQDPERLEYLMSDFCLDGRGRMTCTIKFPSDPVLYTAVDFKGNIQLFS